MEDFRFSSEKMPSTNEQNNPLEEILRKGAQKLLQQAIEFEVQEYLELYKQSKEFTHQSPAVRNGYLPEKNIQTGLGPIAIRLPRIRHRDNGKFTSAILPPYLRRTQSIDAVIPALYLKGISTLDFPKALEAILGENAKGLSPTNIVRLKDSWTTEYQNWLKSDLSAKKYVYIWADGIYFNIRLEEDQPCVLVLIGALENGNKELIMIHDGHRESNLSWKEVLQNLKHRGLKEGPKLAIGDGALGFWAALNEEFPATKQQRCWVHKTTNILDKMPKSVQKYAKEIIHEIYMAPRKTDGLKAFEKFLGTYASKYPKACECLKKDKDQLFSFYDFPGMLWQHIRITSPIESTFATIRHRTRQTKGCESRNSYTCHGLQAFKWRK